MEPLDDEKPVLYPAVDVNKSGVYAKLHKQFSWDKYGHYNDHYYSNSANTKPNPQRVATQVDQIVAVVTTSDGKTVRLEALTGELVVEMDPYSGIQARSYIELKPDPETGVQYKIITDIPKTDKLF